MKLEVFGECRKRMFADGSEGGGRALTLWVSLSLGGVWTTRNDGLSACGGDAVGPKVI